MDAIEIGCTGGCGQKVRADEVESKGWSYLPITGRYRCGTCERGLYRASTVKGAPTRNEPDTLPSNSIGALKKLPERIPLHEHVKP